MFSEEIVKQYRERYPDALFINVKSDYVWDRATNSGKHLPTKVWIVLPTGEVKIEDAVLK